MNTIINTSHVLGFASEAEALNFLGNSSNSGNLSGLDQVQNPAAHNFNLIPVLLISAGILITCYIIYMAVEEEKNSQMANHKSISQ